MYNKKEIKEVLSLVKSSAMNSCETLKKKGERARVKRAGNNGNNTINEKYESDSSDSHIIKIRPDTLQI